MKKILFLSFFLFPTIKIFGQQIDYYAKIGPNLSSVKIDKGSDTKVSKGDPIGSFNCQIFSEIKLRPISLRYGIEFTGKGGDFTDYEGHLKQLRIYYFELPVNGIFTFPVKKNSIYFGAGPYFSAGAGGKNKTYYDSKVVKSNLSLYKSTTDYRPEDIGWNSLVGCKFSSGLIVDAGYEAGEINILTKRANIKNSEKMRNSSFSVSVGHIF